MGKLRTRCPEIAEIRSYKLLKCSHRITCVDRGFQILDERRDGGAERLEEEEESDDKRRARRREEDVVCM